MGLIEKLHRLRNRLDRECVASVGGSYNFFADEMREIVDEVLTIFEDDEEDELDD